MRRPQAFRPCRPRRRAQQGGEQVRKITAEGDKQVSRVDALLDGVVRADVAQSLTDEQKVQARANIGVEESPKVDLTPYAKKAELDTVATTGAYSDLTGKPDIPTKVSQLTNDSGFATASTKVSMAGYADSAGSANSVAVGNVSGLNIGAKTFSSKGGGSYGAIVKVTRDAYGRLTNLQVSTADCSSNCSTD